jgi:ketosteroid isomerase-like protein
MDESAIEKTIFSYQDALNASDVNKVVELYTKNGVLMANSAPTAEGAEQVKGTYQYVFDNFSYTLQFSIIEIVVNGDTAFGRSTSKGSFVIKSSGQTVSDENRELYVFEKVAGNWKIARYMYNKTE